MKETTYNFRPCSFLELKQFVTEKRFVMTIWPLVEEKYMDNLEVVEDNNGVAIALILYNYLEDRHTCELQIGEFEVTPCLRGQGKGKEIILQFLKEHPTSVELMALDDGAAEFWRKCGFTGEVSGMYFYPDE